MEFGAGDLALDAAGARQIFAEAQIDRQGLAYPFEASVLRNGIPLDVVPTIRDDVLLASVPIGPGTNYVQVLLDNGFSRAATGR